MEAPFKETSPTLIIDLVNKFLSKLLVNDPNSSTYLKHWGSFRELLSAAPFNLNPIFSFIGSLQSQPHQSGEYSVSSRLHLPSGLGTPSKDTSCPDSAGTPEKNKNNGLKVDVGHFPGHKRVVSNNFTFPHLNATGMHLKKAASINQLLPSPFKPSTNNLDSAGNQQSSAATGAGRGEGSLAGLDSAQTPSAHHNLKEEEEAGLNYLRNEGQSLTFLAEMARKMKNKIRRHNENIAQRHVVIEEISPAPELRTPLRTVQVYHAKTNPIDSMNIYGVIKTGADAETRSATPVIEDESARKLISNIQKLPLY